MSWEGEVGCQSGDTWKFFRLGMNSEMVGSSPLEAQRSRGLPRGKEYDRERVAKPERGLEWVLPTQPSRKLTLLTPRSQVSNLLN